MSATSHLRGWPIVCTDGVWRYEDTGEPTTGTRRPCGHCGLPDTPEGHDGCLGTLPDVMNACCGHGDIGDAYVQHPGGECIRGEAAIAWIRETRGTTLTSEDRCPTTSTPHCQTPSCDLSGTTMSPLSAEKFWRSRSTR